MSEDTDILLKLLTGGEKDHVRILCEEGEVRINTFILGALSAILKNIIMSLEESNVSLGEKIFLSEGLKQKDLLILFQCLFQQVTEFCPPPKLMEMVQSFLFSEEIDTTIREENADENMDSTCILDDHDYVEQQKPVVIPIKRSQKMIAVEQEELESGFYECHICQVKIPNPPVKSVGRPGLDKFLKIENEHLSSVHGFQLLQTCNYCQSSCADLERHLERGHYDKKCHICGKIAASKKRLEIHLMMHKKIEARELEAKEEKICPHCGKVFQNTIRLNEHIRRACRAIQYEESKCDKCGKAFKNPYAHRSHVLKEHSGKEKRQYICNICGKILFSKNSLDGHHKAFHEIRELKIKCELCGKFFAEKFGLRSHMKKCHTEKETCPICGFKTHNMKIHNQTAHTKDEDKEFQCQDCGKGFVNKIRLERHKISMHLKTKPYNCRYGCDISYSDFSNRNAHEKKTHGKIFLKLKEQKLKEKFEMLGVDVDTLTNPISQYL